MSNEQKPLDPTALGLFGLAIVTLVASSQKLGITSGVSYVMPWALFLGASAQLMAGIIDFKSRNIFGGTAFSAYAFFWYAMAFSWMVNLGVFGAEAQSAGDSAQTGFAFVGYLVFTLYMTVAAAKTNRVLLAIFICIDCLFLGLSLAYLGIAHDAGNTIAAYSELIIALLSFYGSGAAIINHQYKKTVLPVGRLTA